MLSSPIRRPAPPAALLALLAATAGCRTAAPAGAPARTPGIDFGRHGLAHLRGEQREHIDAALADLPCPCGDGHTTAGCLAAHANDPKARRQLRAAAFLAGLGATSSEILEEIQRDRAAFFAPRASLELDPSACKGPADAPVTLVVFSDFECGHCSGFSSLADPLLEQAKGTARLCFKHFPLAHHPLAALAAQAAVHAASQGRFWALHDRLFEHQDALGPADLERYGREVGLDGQGLARALESKAHLLEVEDSVAEGRKLGVDGTPFVFVNGRPITFPLTPEALWLVFDEEQERVSALEAAAGRAPTPSRVKAP